MNKYRKPTAADRMFLQMEIGRRYKYSELPEVARRAGVSDGEDAIPTKCSDCIKMAE